MVASINTNPGSLLGVQSLNKTNSLLGQSEKEISTGLKVADPRDNAAVLSISQVLRSNVAGLSSVKNSLDRAISSADVALAAGNQISELLTSLKGAATKAADAGLDDESRSALNREFANIRDQISSIVENADFNGTNAVKPGGDDIVAVTGEGGEGAIVIAAQDLSVGGSNIKLAPNQGIATAADAETALAAIDESISKVGEALSDLGSGSLALQETKNFTETLTGVTETGIGTLTDADLAATGAQFAATEVRQALGAQALSIANRQPAAILGLFRA